MGATPEQRAESEASEDQASEHTQVQRRVTPQAIPVEQLQYHLFVPGRTRHPLFDSAYELWRDVWQSTFLEAEGSAELYSDEFTRQDEIGVLTQGARCISVTGLRWLDLSRPMSRDDSYFKPWPADCLTALGNGVIGISSNAAVHPDWRGTRVAAPLEMPREPGRLAHVSVGLTIQRFFESPAECSVAVTRNDRGMDRVCFALGASSLSQIELHGVAADVMRFPRSCVRQQEPALAHLWTRRQHG